MIAQLRRLSSGMVLATLALTSIVGPALPSTFAQNTCLFTDMCDVSAPGYSAIKILKEQGIIKGNPDGSFRPDAIVNRAEMLTMLFRGAPQELRYDGAHTFKDVDAKAWYAASVSTAKRLQLVQGHPDGNFKPADGVKTEEAAKMVLTFQKTPLPVYNKGYHGGPQENGLPYGIATDQWYTPYIKTVYDFKLLDNIALAEGLSRADVAILIARGKEQTTKISAPLEFLTTWKPGGSTLLNEGGTISAFLYFSKPVDLSTLQRAIKVTGNNGRKVDNVTFAMYAWGFDNEKLGLKSLTGRPHEVRVDITGLTDYEAIAINVSTELKDIYGTTLTKGSTINYKTAKSPVTISIGGPSYLQKETPARATLLLTADKDAGLNRVTGTLCKVSTDTVLKYGKRTSQYSDDTQKSTEIEYLPIKSELTPTDALKPFCQDIKTTDLSGVSTDNSVGDFDIAAAFKTTLSPGVYFLGAYSHGAADVMGAQQATAHRLIYISDTSMSLKYTRTNPMEGLVWATDMKTNAARVNTAVKVYAVESSDEGNNVWHEVAKGTTDNNGIMRFSMKGELSWSERLLAVTDSSTHFGMVGSSWDTGLEPYNYGLSMAWNGEYGEIKNNRIYLHTDRKIYRPGHDVGIRGVVRTKTQDGYTLPKNLDLTVAVYDSGRKLIQSFPAKVSDQGTFSGQIALGAMAALGEYTVTVTDATPSQEFMWESPIHSTFQVEEYRRPEFRVTLNEGKKDYVTGETLNISGKAEYYFGAPVADGSFTWELTRESLYFQPETGQNEWFSFENGSYCYYLCDTNTGMIASGEGRLNAQGALNMSTPLNLGDVATGGIYTLSVETLDTNQRAVRAEKVFRVHKATDYVGVRTKEYMVKEGNSLNFEVITLNQEGANIPNKSVSLELVREDWTNYAKEDVSGDTMAYNDRQEKVIATQSVQTGQNARANVTFPAQAAGQYFVRARVSDAQGRINTAREYTYVYPKDENGYMSWAQDDVYKTQILLDKPVYKPGDEAKMIIQSPYKEATALITMERGTVIDTMRVELTSNAAPISIPVKAAYVPNVYISAVVMPKGGEQGLKLGYGTMMVDTEQKELNIALSTNKATYAPGEKVTLDVSTTDNNGRAVSADVSVAVVDESIIALAGGVDRDIMRAFYTMESLAVWTAHSLTHFVEQGLIRSVGGSGKGGPSGLPILRGLLKDTAYWNPRIVTDASGKARVEFTLPDNLTRWEMLAIGVTKDTQVGSSSKEIDTRQDLIIQPVLPRFVREGDKVALTYTIFNLSNTAEQIQMSLTSPQLPLTEQLFVETIPAGGSKTAVWHTTIPRNLDAIELSASAQGTRNSDRLITRLEVASSDTFDVSGVSGNVTGKEATITPAITSKATIDRTRSTLNIKVSAGLLGSLTPSLSYLLQYPYGCSEQTTSSMLGNILLADFMKNSAVALPGVSKETIDANVAAALTRLYAYQANNGGFALWGGDSGVDTYLSAYVLEGMQLANESGFAVDTNVMKKLRTYLQTELSNGAVTDMNTRASVLAILRRTGSTGLDGTADTLFKERSKLTWRSRAALVHFYSNTDSQIARERTSILLGEMRSAMKIENGKAFMTENKESAYTFYYDNVSSTAAVLEAFAVAAPDDKLIPSIVSFLLANRNEGMWASTHENALILRGLNKILSKNPGTTQATNIEVRIGSTSKTLTFAQGALSAEQEIRIPLTELSSTSFPVTLKNSLGGTTYYDASISYVSNDTEKPVTANGYRITRELLEKKDGDLQSLRHQLKVGESVFIRLNFQGAGGENGRHIAIEDMLPAGLELLNPRIQTENGLMRVDQGWLDSYELRDDRGFFYLATDRDTSITVEARAIAPGTFTYPAAKASEMYRPAKYARTAPMQLTITR